MAFGDRQKRVHPGFWQTFMYGWTNVPEDIDISPAEQRAGVGAAFVGGLAGATAIPGAAAGKGAVAVGGAIGAGGAWVIRGVMGIIGKFKDKQSYELDFKKGKDTRPTNDWFNMSAPGRKHALMQFINWVRSRGGFQPYGKRRDPIETPKDMQGVNITKSKRPHQPPSYKKTPPGL